MRVLALDPGERVGWAAATIDVETPQLRVTEHGIEYLKAAAQRFCAEIEAGAHDVVVIERWNLTSRGARVLIGSDMPWSQFYGMIRKSVWDTPGVRLVPQWPSAMSTARAWLKTDKAKAVGGEDVAERVAKTDAVAHDDAHDGSALLHLFHYFFDKHV